MNMMTVVSTSGIKRVNMIPSVTFVSALLADSLCGVVSQRDVSYDCCHDGDENRCLVI